MAPLLSLFTAILLSLTGTRAESWDRSIFESPPVYPSPKISGVGGWESALLKADLLLGNLTLEEKVLLLTGNNGPCVGNIAPILRVGFKGLCLQDGPLSLRQADYVSVFPAGLTAAASWDRALIKTRGEYLGAEFRDKGAHVFLGPVAGPLGRAGMGGRGWEGFSPDPYLTGVAMEETIIGVQSQGVQACAKHFLAYEQETQRNPAGTFDPDVTPFPGQILSVSSNVEDRTMHELYMWPFANSVRAGVASVMCAYNRVNSTYACENSKLQNGMLKTELGFDGYIVSDWEGTHSLGSAEAGLDMNMPGAWNWDPDNQGKVSWFGGNLTAAVRNGTVTQDRVDDMVRRVLTPYYLMGQDLESFPTLDGSTGSYPQLADFAATRYWDQAGYSFGEASRDVRRNHSTLTRELGAAGTVLLKNTNSALPLKAPKRIGVFGNAAGDLTNGLYPLSNDYEYGCLPAGGGSGSGRYSYLVTPLEAINARARQGGSSVQYILNNTLLAGDGGASITYPIPDVCIVMIKMYASEGSDRTTLHADHDGDSVIEQVAKYCPNTIVVAQNTGIELMPWATNPNVTAIVVSHLSGNEIGNSLVDVLYGDYNPSGKLPYSIAHQESDYYFANITREVADPTDPNAWQSDFTEKLLIDYRHFDYYNVSVMFEFGFGLSYTTFDLANLTISKLQNNSISALPVNNTIVPGGNPDLWNNVIKATTTVTNTGSVAGSTVAQLYLTLPESAGEGTPIQQLRGFEKIPLEPGESKSVTFELMRRDLSIWDVVEQQWRIPEGEFGIKVGFSSRDKRVAGTFHV